MSAKILFEPRDLWIGIYWTRCRVTNLDSDVECYSIYVCIVPCFPILFRVNKQIPSHKRHLNW